MTDRDSKDMKEMVYSAKVGQWSTVFRILDKNPKFVNCIPEGRTWAALHQAIYLNNASAMKKLFEYPACDVDIETKADAVGHGPGRTPLVLAKMLSKEDGRDRNDLASFLKEKSEERHGGCIPSYVTVKEGVKVDRVGSPLLLDALAQYKKTFNPDEIDTQELFNTTMKVSCIKVMLDRYSRHWFLYLSPCTTTLRLNLEKFLYKFFSYNYF